MHVIHSIFPSCTGVEFFAGRRVSYTGIKIFWYPFMSNNRSITFDQIKSFVKYTGCSGICLYQFKNSDGLHGYL